MKLRSAFSLGGLLVAVACVWGALGTDAAQARPARHAGGAHGPHGPKHAGHGPGYRPPYAEIVVDGNSGDVLHELNADEPRHPASVTKIMTLFLLFEQIEAGRFALDTPLDISAHAAAQRPTKLGFKANQTITVEDAIGGLVTRSANDASVVIAEAIGGSEEEFASLMTRKAKALGMTNTTYINASGLPADDQFTTARDQALLGRAIRERFPGFYRYFSTLNFRYRGADIHNHNGLLGNVEGVDGIKTGYTDASGYNLVASVNRGGKRIVAVVLGGTSNATRNIRMRQMIEEFVRVAATTRTAPQIVEAPGGTDSSEDGKPRASAGAVASDPAETPAAAPDEGDAAAADAGQAAGSGQAGSGPAGSGNGQARITRPSGNRNFTFASGAVVRADALDGDVEEDEGGGPPPARPHAKPTKPGKPAKPAPAVASPKTPAPARPDRVAANRHNGGKTRAAAQQH